MNKNRKAHFVLLNIDGPSAAVAEVRTAGGRISENVIRYSPFASQEHEEGPSAMMPQGRSRPRSRRRGGGFRGDREGASGATVMVAATAAIGSTPSARRR